MDALTLHQPVASMMGDYPFKNIENRIWAPPAKVLGRRIAIHAGLHRSVNYTTWLAAQASGFSSNEVSEFHHRLASPVSGCVVSTAVLRGWWDARTKTGKGRHINTIESSRWFLGPVGWLFSDFQILAEPIPCKGHQKLWHLPDTISETLYDETCQ